MKIEAASAHHAARLRRRTAVGASGSSFAEILDEYAGEASATADTAHAAAVAGPGMLLALQSVDDATYQRHRARVRGEGLLDRLEDLRRMLLLGRVPLDRLNDLARMVESQRPTVSDPGLQGVLDDIDLRVQVELAKLRP